MLRKPKPLLELSTVVHHPPELVEGSLHHFRLSAGQSSSCRPCGAILRKNLDFYGKGATDRKSKVLNSRSRRSRKGELRREFETILTKAEMP